jgi:hypothetical protein
VPLDRSVTRRIALLVLCLGASASAAGLSGSRTGPARQAIAALADTLAFEVEYAGIGAEGVDLIWRGRAKGSAPAQVTIRMEYAGGSDDHAMPVWPVNVWLFYSADNYRSSFAAELSGSMNWRTGELRVSGLVSDGLRMNVPLEQRVQLHRPGLAGAVTVVFLPRVALSDARAARF